MFHEQEVYLNQHFYPTTNSSISSKYSSKDEKVIKSSHEFIEKSNFEVIFTKFPPIIDVLLSHLPTSAIICLSQTSRHLRGFLTSQYPLAWSNLSFRSTQASSLTPHLHDPDGYNTRNPKSKAYNFDGLLGNIYLPLATRLSVLNLCNTAVNGLTLFLEVVKPRVTTLQHLSVRGCKNVSIKYHILPFLQSYVQRSSDTKSPWNNRNELKLKSLYSYRCRHHRRRPYLPASLVRKDSDSEPTHELIEVCHKLGIWVDTAWCTSPGPRCIRRRNYHTSHVAPGRSEIWVPFDRLWRSLNRVGSSGEKPTSGIDKGSKYWKIWEDLDYGYDGEPLRRVNASGEGEDKNLPVHLRWSHKVYIEGIKCHECGDNIPERCEQCSVQMHCMGCRKTLCASCAYNRPLPRRRDVYPSLSEPKLQNQSKFWWAPGCLRSPNIMMNNATEIAVDIDSDEDVESPTEQQHTGQLLKLEMYWCCLEPLFSGGGGIVFMGLGTNSSGSEKLRSSPLPAIDEFKDADFSIKNRLFKSGLSDCQSLSCDIDEEFDILPLLMQHNVDLHNVPSPRNLCKYCYHSRHWNIKCHACHSPLCKEHDFRGLKVRKCGYRELTIERNHLFSYKKPLSFEIPPFHRIQKRKNGGWYSPAFAATSSTTSTLTSIPSTTTNLPISASGSSKSTSLSRIGGLVPNESRSLIDTVISSTTTMTAIPPPPSITAMTATSTASPGTSSDLPIVSTRKNRIVDHPIVPICLDDLPPRLNLSKPRSYSLSEIGKLSLSRSRSLNVWDSRPPLPCTPGHPVQWQGCGHYFCLPARSMGDPRVICNAALNECSDCHVFVCMDCYDPLLSCDCRFCSVNYYCPNCFKKPSVRSQCAKTEEEDAKRFALEQIHRQIAQDLQDRIQADELADLLSEFLESATNLNSNPPTSTALPVSSAVATSNMSSDGSVLGAP